MLAAVSLAGKSERNPRNRMSTPQFRCDNGCLTFPQEDRAVLLHPPPDAVAARVGFFVEAPQPSPGLRARLSPRGE